MKETSLKPVIEKLESLFSKFKMAQSPLQIIHLKSSLK